MDKNKGLKIPVQLRVNMWLGLTAYEKKFNSFSEGTFSVYAQLVSKSEHWSETYIILKFVVACCGELPLATLWWPFCSPVLVRESGSGFWEVGNHGPSWPA